VVTLCITLSTPGVFQEEKQAGYCAVFESLNTTTTTPLDTQDVHLVEENLPSLQLRFP